MQILMKSNLSTMSKENVLAKVDIDNVSELHINVKKTLRDLKSLSEPEIVKPGKEVKTDKNSSRVEVKQKSSQRMEDDSSLKIYSKRFQECFKRMEDEEQRERSSRIPEDEHKKWISP